MVKKNSPILFLLLNIVFVSCNHDSSEITKKGKEFYEKGNYSEAIHEFNSAVEINEEDTVAYYLRGESYLNLNKLDSAKLDFEKVLSLDPSYQLFSSYFFIGYIYYSNNDFVKAIKYITIHLEKNSMMKHQNPYSYLYRAASFNKLSDYENAIKDIDKAIQIDSTLAEAYYQRGIINLNRFQKPTINYFSDISKAINMGNLAAKAYLNNNYIEKIKHYLNDRVPIRDMEVFVNVLQNISFQDSEFVYLKKKLIDYSDFRKYILGTYQTSNSRPIISNSGRYYGLEYSTYYLFLYIENSEDTSYKFIYFESVSNSQSNAQVETHTNGMVMIGNSSEYQKKFNFIYEDSSTIYLYLKVETEKGNDGTVYFDNTDSDVKSNPSLQRWVYVVFLKDRIVINNEIGIRRNKRVETKKSKIGGL